MTTDETNQVHKSNKFHKACVDVPTHVVLGGGAIL